jgi:hypothetical protein
VQITKVQRQIFGKERRYHSSFQRLSSSIRRETVADCLRKVLDSLLAKIHTTAYVVAGTCKLETNQSFSASALEPLALS